MWFLDIFGNWGPSWRSKSPGPQWEGATWIKIPSFCANHVGQAFQEVMPADLLQALDASNSVRSLASIFWTGKVLEIVCILRMFWIDFDFDVIGVFRWSSCWDISREFGTQFNVPAVNRNWLRWDMGCGVVVEWLSGWETGTGIGWNWEMWVGAKLAMKV